MTFTRSSASVSASSATRGLSSALQDLRDARGLTVYAVCKRTGLSRSVLEAAEADAVGTKYGVLVVLAEFYGLDETSWLATLGEMAPDVRRYTIQNLGKFIGRMRRIAAAAA